MTTTKCYPAPSTYMSSDISAVFSLRALWPNIKSSINAQYTWRKITANVTDEMAGAVQPDNLATHFQSKTACYSYPGCLISVIVSTSMTAKWIIPLQDSMGGIFYTKIKHFNKLLLKKFFLKCKHHQSLRTCPRGEFYRHIEIEKYFEIHCSTVKLMPKTKYKTNKTWLKWNYNIQ